MAETAPEATADLLRRQIAERAYALWEEEGCPHGRDVDHWLKAEAECAAGGHDAPEVAAQAASRKRSEKPAA